MARKSKIIRETKETNISLSLDVDGSGNYDISTPIPFLNHMLELFSKHSGIDIDADIKGDLKVDEHHTVEDTAIVLGKAINQALGEKLRIARYGFLLPMDEARAETAIDFSGRPYLVWKVKFKTKKVGDVPTDMFEHFFKSFCDHAGCNLFIKAKGKNDHHKIEAIFKSLARATKNALRRSSSETGIPSTKGTL